MNNGTTLALAELIVGCIINVSGVWALVHYRINKKFKADRHKGVLPFIEANWVELVITAVVVPNWPQMVRSWMQLYTG